MIENSVTQRVIWRLHADKLMLLHDNNVHTAMLGYQMVANWFNHTPPSTLDIEYAIQSIEDGLSPLRAALPEGAQFYSDDGMLNELAQRMNIFKRQLTREQVEADFDALLHNLNRPMAMANTPLSQQTIAYELVLREAMHHLDIAFVNLGI